MSFLACAVLGLPMQQSAAHQGSMQHSYPVLGSRRGQGRRLPPTPSKPSTLQLRPGPINFPKLNASPTHVSKHIVKPTTYLVIKKEWVALSVFIMYRVGLGKTTTVSSIL